MFPSGCVELLQGFSRVERAARNAGNERAIERDRRGFQGPLRVAGVALEGVRDAKTPASRLHRNAELVHQSVARAVAENEREDPVLALGAPPFEHERVVAGPLLHEHVAARREPHARDTARRRGDGLAVGVSAFCDRVLRDSVPDACSSGLGAAPLDAGAATTEDAEQSDRAEQRAAGVHAVAAPRARATNSAVRARSLTPGVPASTPLATSTPNGKTSRIASATLSGSRPPARISGRSRDSSRTSDQSKTCPVPPCAGAAFLSTKSRMPG